MKFLKVLLFIFIALVIIVFIGAAFIPSKLQFAAQRSMHVKKEIVFSQVNCFQNWTYWTPWKKVITNEVLSGPACGTGALMSWSDDSRGGTQEILETEGNNYIKTQLHFNEQAVSYSEWNFKEEDGLTEVSWSFETELAFPLGRWVGILFIKPGIEQSFVLGLEQLEQHCLDLDANLPIPQNEIRLQTVLPQTLICVEGSGVQDDIPDLMGLAYATISLFIERQSLNYDGFPLSIWHTYSPEPDSLNVFECAIPIQEKNFTSDEIKIIQSYTGQVVTGVHHGSYESSYITWTAIDEYIQKNSLINNGSPWEVYITDSASEPDTNKWLTQIYQPVK